MLLQAHTTATIMDTRDGSTWAPGLEAKAHSDGTPIIQLAATSITIIEEASFSAPVTSSIIAY